jgi:hypothetical protein
VKRLKQIKNLVASITTIAETIVDSRRMQTLTFEPPVMAEKLAIAAGWTKSKGQSINTS